MMKKILKIVWTVLGVLYYPIYAVAWFTHKIARLILAISYFLMFNKRVALDIIKNLFK